MNKKIIQTIAVRGVELLPWREARAQAVRQGKTNGQWLTEAIKEKLARDNPQARLTRILSKKR